MPQASAVPTKAVLYARVSSKEQEKDGFSIPAQQKLLRQYALDNNVSIVREFTDVETAKRSGRTGFAEMLAFLKRNSSCRMILVEKTDRLYRNLKDWVTIDGLDVEVHFVKENVVLSNGSRSSEKFVHGIKVLMAKNYIDNLSEETRKGMLEKAEQGTWPSYAPLGYLNVDGPNAKRTIAPDPALAPIIRRIFEWYVTGEYSFAEVTRKASEAGMVFRKTGNAVPRATIHKILHNRIYTGDFDFDGQTYRGTYEAIITRELWQRVQEIIQQRLGRRRQKQRHDFAFSGLIACGHCGCSLVAELKKRKYIYYHCTGNKGKCPEPYVREEVLEAEFTKALRSLRFDDDVLAWIKQALRQSHADERREHEQAIARLQAEQTKLQRRIDAMYEDKLDGVIDEAFFKRKADEARTEQAKLSEQIERHQQANQNYIEDGARLLDLANRAAEIFERQPATEKRKLLRFVIAECRWKDGQFECGYRKPFDLIAEFEWAGKTRKPKKQHSNRNVGIGSTDRAGAEVTAHQGVVPMEVVAGKSVQTAQKARNENWLDPERRHGQPEIGPRAGTEENGSPVFANGIANELPKPAGTGC
jgi:DNA invertase Pin-like site-specific DNA recombinase